MWSEIQIIWKVESNSDMIKAKFFHYTDDKTEVHILSNIYSYNQSANKQWVLTVYALVSP